jgi:tape measure domain-containing protein
VATPNEVELLIRARNEASKTLSKVGAEIDDIVKSQKELADVNVLAGKSQKELAAQAQLLLGTLTNLSKLLNDVRAYRTAQQAAEQLRKTITEKQAAYAALKTQLESVEKPTRKMTAEFRKAGAEISGFEKSLAGTDTKLAKMGAALTEAGIDLNKLADAEQRVVALADKTARSYDVATQALRDQSTAVDLVREAEMQGAVQAARSKAATEAQTRAIRENIAVLDQRRARLRQAVETFSAASDGDLRNTGSRAALQADLAALKATQLRAEAEIRVARINERATIVEQRLAAARRSGASASNESAAATQRAAGAQTVFVNSGKTALSLYQRVRGQVLAMASAYVGLFGAINLARGSVDAAISREAINARLISASGGDARAAAEEYKFLRAEADRLGVNFENAAGAYSRFAIAARSAGQTVEQTRFIFTAFSESAAVLRLTGDETAGVFKALEQIFSKGKVQAEELRGQLGDRLSGSFTLFAKSLGITNAELDKFLEKGQISSEQIIGLAVQAQKEFGPGLAGAINGTQSNIERLNNAVFEFKNELFNGSFGQEFLKLTKQFTSFLKSTDGKKFAEDLSRAFGDVARGLGDIIRNFDKIGPIVTGLASVVGVLADNLGKVLATLILISGARTVVFFLQVRAAMLGTSAAAATLGTTTTVAAGGMTILGRAVTGLGVAIRFMLGPVGLALLALSALAYQFKRLQKASEDAKKPTDAMREALEKLENARGTDEEGAARQRVIDLGAEARARLGAAKATLAQAKANLELSRSTNGPMGEPGERAARAGTELAFSTTMREAEARVNQLERDIQAGERERTGFGKGIRGGKPFAPKNNAVEIPVFDPNSGDSGEDAAKAALKLAEERQRLAEQARDAIFQIEKDILGAAEDNLQARLDLIDLEFAERIKKLEELKAENIAAGTEENKAVAGQLGAQIERLKLLQAEEKARTRIEFQQQALEEGEERLNALIAARDAEVEAIEARQAVGLLTAEEARQAIRDKDLQYQQRILDQTQQVRDILLSLPPGLFDELGGEALLARLDAIEVRTKNIVTESQRLAQTYREDFAQAGADAFGELGKGIANYLQGVNSLSDAFKAARDSFLNFIADFLVEIGKAIIKQQILNVLQNQAKKGGDGLFGTLANLVLGRQFHSGGVIGRDSGRQRKVSPAWFAGAQRFHSGGLPGLKSDEVPAILQKGEQVLSKNDPNNVLNGGGGKAPVINITNAIDSSSVIEQGMATPAGTRSVLNVVRANKSAFKALLT